MSETGPALLRLRAVSKTVKSQSEALWLLRDIDLTVRAGEFVSILGPSGSGKSSLLNILGMFDQDWEGEYHFRGRPVHALKPAERQRLGRAIGFVFQQYHLLDDLTVEENLLVPLKYRDVSHSDGLRRVEAILERFAIADKKYLYPGQLSGGQQQLVAVARSIIGEPSVILADEPTGALHSSQGDMIMDLLDDLNRQGLTILQVTHNESYAQRGHRRIELFDGQLRQETATRGLAS